MAMLRLARAIAGDPAPDALVHLMVSVRTPTDLYYADELRDRSDTTVLYTRTAPPVWPRAARRLDADDVLPHLRDDQAIFVCGSAPFTNAVGDLLVDLGVAPERARFERFGPSA
jgi:ferredoxin-NADP reductase